MVSGNYWNRPSETETTSATIKAPASYLHEPTGRANARPDERNARAEMTSFEIYGDSYQSPYVAPLMGLCVPLRRLSFAGPGSYK